MPGASAASAEAAPQQLHDATIEQSLFQGVTVPALVMAQLGTLRVDRNTVRNAYGGFWFVSLADPAQIHIFDQFAVGDPAVYQKFAEAGIAALRDGIFVIATAIGQVLPATPPARPPCPEDPRQHGRDDVARQTPSALLPTIPRRGSAGPSRSPTRERAYPCGSISVTARSTRSSPILVPGPPPLVGFTPGAGSAVLHDSRIRSRFPMAEQLSSAGSARPSSRETSWRTRSRP